MGFDVQAEGGHAEEGRSGPAEEDEGANDSRHHDGGRELTGVRCAVGERGAEADEDRRDGSKDEDRPDDRAVCAGGWNGTREGQRPGQGACRTGASRTELPTWVLGTPGLQNRFTLNKGTPF